MHLPDGTLLQGGEYRILRFISSGGFGCTYEAEHTQLQSRVAVKEFFVKNMCIRSADTAEVSLAIQSQAELLSKLRKKFLEEARAVFRMHHPHIVRVIDIFEENGTAYYAMDYIDGKSLSELVNERGPLPEEEAVKYIRQVAEALRYIHSLNRLHLDIKPGNIMVNASGDAILIDFGTSKQYDEAGGENTSTLLATNTKGYTPIEQMNTSFTHFSPATDIYALGATLYKLLTAVTPPNSISLSSDAEALAPLPTAISANVREAVSAAMQLRLRERPQTIDAFLAILNAESNADNELTTLVSANQTAAHATDDLPPQPQKNWWCRLSLGRKVIFVVFLAFCALVLGVFIYHGKDVARNMRWGMGVIQTMMKQSSSSKGTYNIVKGASPSKTSKPQKAQPTTAQPATQEEEESPVIDPTPQNSDSLPGN